MSDGSTVFILASPRAELHPSSVQTHNTNANAWTFGRLLWLAVLAYAALC